MMKVLLHALGAALSAAFGTSSGHTKPSNGQPNMNKPSERIVVFVTPAQKRAISSTADELGISVSELMRRAVLAFNATSDQVKAASIVDRLNAPREPDALAQALLKAARPLRPSLKTRPLAQRSPDPAGAGAGAAQSAAADEAPTRVAAEALPPAATASGDAAREVAQAVARLSADTAPDTQVHDEQVRESPWVSLSSSPFAPFGGKTNRAAHDHADDTDDARTGPAPEDGHFA